MARLNYIEFPSGDIGAAKSFYGSAFGWTFTDYGPDYAAAEGAGSSIDGADIGLNGDKADQTTRLLPVIEVDSLDAARAAVVAAGGAISRDIFAYPGGRRFHCIDLNGNEIGVYEIAE